MTDRIEATLRKLVIGLFLFGVFGAGTELLLLGHYEEFWQWIPLVLLGTSVPLTAWVIIRPLEPVVRLFRFLMSFFVAAGFVGQYQHFRGNVEFELEMYPSMDGTELVWEALTGATPALAPGTMTVLGLLGLIFTIRHPSLATPSPITTSKEEAQ